MDGEGKIIITDDGRHVWMPPSPRARHLPSTGLRRREQNSAAPDTVTATSPIEGNRPDDTEQLTPSLDNMSPAPDGAMNQAEVDQRDEMELDMSDANDDMVKEHPMRAFDHETSQSPTKSVSKVSRKDPSPASSALKSLAARNSNFARTFWEKRVKYASKGNISIGSVIEHLGLKRHQSGTNFSFENKTVNKLVQTLRVITHKISDGDDAQALDAQALDAHVVDVAADPAALASEVDKLMNEFGEKIWGAEGVKEWLETPGEYGEYAHELHFHDEEENKLIREYLRLWIVLKAINTRIYTKYQKVPTKQEVEDEESTDGSEADDELDQELDAYDPDSAANGKEASHTKVRLQERNPFVRIVKLQDSTLVMAFRLDPAKARKARTANNAFSHDEVIHSSPWRSATPSDKVQDSPKTPQTTRMRDEEHESAIKTAESKVARLRAAWDAVKLEETTKARDASPTVEKPVFPAATKTEKTPAAQFVSTVAQRLADSPRTRGKTPVYNENILAGIKSRASRKDKGIPHKIVPDAPVDSAAAEQAQQGTPKSQDDDTITVMPREQSTQDDHAPGHTSLAAGKKRALSPSSNSRAMRRPQKKKNKSDAHEAAQKKNGKKPAAPVAQYTEDPDPIRRRMLHSRPLTTAFMRYLDPRVRQKYSSKSLLANIELGGTHLMLSVVPVALPTILAAWLAYQRTVVSVKKRAPAALDPDLTKEDSAIVRSRLRTALRMARDEFVASHEDAQAILRRAIENMLGGDERADYVGDGMKALDEELEALGERLGGGRWIMMG